MKLSRCLKHAFNMVLHSKLRSWLTILGIVIGVASVIAIVSLGESMQQTLNSRLNTLGGDIITVSPGFSRGGNMLEGRGEPGGSSGSSQATSKTITLTRTDVQVLRGIPNVGYIDTEIRGNIKVSYMGKNGSVSATGVDQKVWAQVTTLKTAQGRLLDPTDQNVVVIGGRLASSYFSKPVGVNQMITISGSSYRVVGILDDETTSVYMPITMAYQVISDKINGEYDSLVLKIKDQNLLNETMTEIDNSLMMERHVTSATKDYSVTSSKQTQETMAATMSSMEVFLEAIAAVSLLVGAVGVANTMFTSVMEKTKEIGIMKSIGAKNKDILMIFLLNSSLIGLVGGIIGIIFGTILSAFLPVLLGNVGMLSSGIVSLNSIILAVSVSLIIGSGAGIIPAYQASKLKPVDALRYE